MNRWCLGREHTHPFQLPLKLSPTIRPVRRQSTRNIKVVTRLRRTQKRTFLTVAALAIICRAKAKHAQISNIMNRMKLNGLKRSTRQWNKEKLMNALNRTCLQIVDRGLKMDKIYRIVKIK